MEVLQHRAKELAEYFIGLRHKIHAHPETAFQEKNTCRIVREELARYGIDEQYEVAETGVLGVLRGRNGGKRVMLRADMDALPLTETTNLSFSSENPGVCHACGHDVHTSSLLLAARILSENKNALHGDVLFLFQPAEEIMQGACSVIASDVWERECPDAIFGMHTWPELPAGTVGFRQGTMMAAADGFRIVINAAGGHGAHPERTADPVVCAAQIVLALQTIVSRELSSSDSAVVTVGKIASGGAANVIPAEVVLEGTARTLTPATQQKVRSSIIRITEGISAVACTKVTVEFPLSCPPVIPDPTLTEFVERIAGETIGKDNVRHLNEVSMGSEDFAFYLEHIPGAFFRLGTADSRPESRLSLHNPGLVFSDEAISTGGAVLAAVAMQYVRT